MRFGPSWFFLAGALLLASAAVQFVQLVVVDPHRWDDMLQLGTSGATAVALVSAAWARSAKVAALRAGFVYLGLFALEIVLLWVIIARHAGAIELFGLDLGHPFGHGSAAWGGGYDTDSVGRPGGYQGDPILGVGVTLTFGIRSLGWTVVSPVFGVLAWRAGRGAGWGKARAIWLILATTPVWFGLGTAIVDVAIARIVVEAASLAWLVWALTGRTRTRGYARRALVGETAARGAQRTE